MKCRRALANLKCVKLLGATQCAKWDFEKWGNTLITQFIKLKCRRALANLKCVKLLGATQCAKWDFEKWGNTLITQFIKLKCRRALANLKCVKLLGATQCAKMGFWGVSQNRQLYTTSDIGPSWASCFIFITGDNDKCNFLYNG